MQMGAHMFVIGLKLAVPVVAALFMADLALGLSPHRTPDECLCGWAAVQSGSR